MDEYVASVIPGLLCVFCRSFGYCYACRSWPQGSTEGKNYEGWGLHDPTQVDDGIGLRKSSRNEIPVEKLRYKKARGTCRKSKLVHMHRHVADVHYYFIHHSSPHHTHTHVICRRDQNNSTLQNGAKSWVFFLFNYELHNRTRGLSHFSAGNRARGCLSRSYRTTTSPPTILG